VKTDVFMAFKREHSQFIMMLQDNAFKHNFQEQFSVSLGKEKNNFHVSENCKISIHDWIGFLI